jgi:hypothetical protein
MPNVDTRTTLSIVTIVTPPKTPDTSNSPARLLLAAGYKSIGISGSHGPSTNIVNNTQGVILLVLFPA